MTADYQPLTAILPVMGGLPSAVRSNCKDGGLNRAQEIFVTRRRRLLSRLLVLNVILLVLSFAWYGNRTRGVRLAVAKSGIDFYAYTLPQTAVSPAIALDILRANPVLNNALGARELEFVLAVPLTPAEARPWANLGCGAGNCIQATLYDHENGGTVEVVLNRETAVMLASWAEPYARPAGTPLIAERALEIAAADAGVQAILGNIKSHEPAMVPMSAWLADDACREQWCVDLTYLDPAGSGRIFHVFVNLEEERVARTFFTRAREPQAAPAIPPMQRFAFNNGCNEQYGWRVCWEMTAHDGLLFSQGTFNEQPIFNDIKIAQVEAWYPSWPGGYRDEIGFAASVPPFGGTQVNDLGTGFEVIQLFTEFTYWPNCICCYRYEQIARFFADGRFELSFVSHGPGCDDLSIYRPFWRIDMDLGGEANTAWLWQDGRWTTPATEFELFPVVDDVAPDGTRLAIEGGNLLYAWEMARTDPLGLDEARLFVLQMKPGEGTGPVPTGPGDTFQPPRQWLDGDPLPQQNLVVWFVPLLKTKKLEPLWCMPDPEPGINQCEAILRISPVSELRVPTPEELALPTPTPTPTPIATATPAPTPTPRPVQGDNAADLILNAGCGACHQIGRIGEAHKVGPNLTNIADVAGERVPGLSAAEYIYQSIVEPGAYIAPDCPNGPCLANIMPRDYGARLTPEQIEAIVNYLLFEVQNEPPAEERQPIGATAVQTPKSVPAGKTAVTPPPIAENAPVVAIQLLLVTLVLLLTMFLLGKEKEG